MDNGGLSILESRDRYMDALALRGRSPHTLATYGAHLGRFFAFLRERGVDPAASPAAALEVEHIELYLAARTRAGAAPATRQLILQALSGFYRYLCLRDLLSLNTESLRVRLAALTVRVPRRRPDPPAHLEWTTDAGLVRAQGAARKRQNVQAEILSVRNIALLQTLYATGMRVSEVVSLNRPQIQEGGYAVVTGKGGKQRTVYFSDAALSAIAAYLALRTDDSAPLFVQHHNPIKNVAAHDATADSAPRPRVAGKRAAPDYRLSSRMVQRIVQQMAVATGLEATPHTYRHHFATTVLHSGHLDVRDVQELLGHASLATTQIYLHPRHERLAGALKVVFATPADEA